jgi:hypothetical protein
MRKITFVTTVVTAAAILIPGQSGSSSTASMNAKTAVLSSTGISVSYKDEIKLTSKRCGEFQLKYSVRWDPNRAIVQLYDRSGNLLGDEVISRVDELNGDWDDRKGTLYFEYCKTRWKDDWGNVFPAFNGGWVNVHVTNTLGDQRVTSKGRFFVKK